ncbi:ion transporter [Candidatus Poribacteria bacterium]|nr:ion transporter [Candidatus Poribacteria bacterium]MYB64454.1 ion transporter [Candidatus Poribacteria bacterium]MYF55154.1 ion transporter [Candidatus Poribacteria bacterium]MYI94998.1 ion transporter [Candidatus Poribacteria bacterium]
MLNNENGGNSDLRSRLDDIAKGNENGGNSDLRSRLDDIVEGPVFSGIIQFLILASAITFALESEYATKDDYVVTYKYYFDIIDWSFLILFSAEYLLRIYTARKRLAFIFSFFGIVDLLAILPSIVAQIPAFRVLRVLRFLRVFRIFKATRFILAMDRMIEALAEVRREILALVILSSMLVYLAACGIHFFEKDAQPEEFGSIPDAMWWAIVTLTTIGYGDVYPITAGGKIFTAVIALIGIGLIAIPSGLLASVLTEARVEEEILEEEQEESGEK